MIEAAFNGTVANDPQIRTSKAGKPWMSVGITVGNGDDRQYVQAAVFGDLAKSLDGKLTKGAKVYAEGHLRLNEYEKDGVKKSSLNMACTRLDRTHMIGKQSPERQKVARAAPAHDHQMPPAPFNDEIGF